jgi:hypothetical protein
MVQKDNQLYLMINSIIFLAKTTQLILRDSERVK